jgi:prophage DNA circulation protein
MTFVDTQALHDIRANMVTKQPQTKPVPVDDNNMLEAIRASQPATTWRAALLPASFRNCHFHVDSGSKDNGRRIVVHEFPKKELPYAEDMGRRAKSFSVRAYCICYPTTFNGPGLELYNTDYRVARDLLLNAMETAGPGILQLPLLPPETVVVNRYRLTEEQKFGGYCTFDIDFVEFGVPPQYLTNSLSTGALLNTAADTLRQQIAAGKAGPIPVPGAPDIVGNL